MINQYIEAELSYAYLHAVAAKAGISCKPGDRHDDGEGVDAELNFRGISSHPYLKHVQINVQLKGTIKEAGKHSEYWSYFIKGKNRFEKLRTNDSVIYKILIVLFMPSDPSNWISCTPDELILKKAAYWVNLYGADPCTNDSGQTVYIPKKNLITPDELLSLADSAANKNIPPYIKPIM